MQSGVPLTRRECSMFLQYVHSTGRPYFVAGFCKLFERLMKLFLQKAKGKAIVE